MRFCTVVIDCSACILWALFLLLIPLKWMAAFFLAAFTHELFHCLAILCMKKRIEKLRIGFGGIKMDVADLGYGEELICALVGPIGGLILVSLCRWYPELSICGVIQSAYNLLPIYPLDGGRALSCAARMMFPRYADHICTGVEILSLIGILTLGFLMKNGIYSLIISVFLTVKILHGKIPCNHSVLGVQ